MLVETAGGGLNHFQSCEFIPPSPMSPLQQANLQHKAEPCYGRGSQSVSWFFSQLPSHLPQPTWCPISGTTPALSIGKDNISRSRELFWCGNSVAFLGGYRWDGENRRRLNDREEQCELKERESHRYERPRTLCANA